MNNIPKYKLHLNTEAFADTLPQGFVFQDSEGKILFSNAYALRILGVTLEEIQGRDSNDTNWMAIQENGYPFPGEEHPSSIALKTGNEIKNKIMGVFNSAAQKYIWINIHAIPVFTGEKSEPSGVYITFEDITEFKKNKDFETELYTRLRQSSIEIAQRQNAIDKHAIVAITDKNGTIVYVNQRFCKISKYSKEELIGKNHRIINSGYHSKFFFQNMYSAIQSGDTWHGEIRNRAKDKSYYWVATTIAPLRNVNGEIEQYLAIRTDITERVNAEEALRVSEARTRAILDNSLESILFLNPNKTIEFYNNVAANNAKVIFNTELRVGESILSFISSEEKELFEKSFQCALQGEIIIMEKFFLIHNTKLWFEIQYAPIKNTANQIIGVLLNARDINEKKRADPKNDLFWRNLKQGLPAPAPEVPFIFNKFIAALEGAGIKVDRKNDTFQILPQTDEDITKMSSGPIQNAKTFKVKGQNLIPEKGGLFDPVNTGIFGQNFNHVDLNFSIPNPISEDPLRRLLKMTKEQYETNIANGTVQTALRSLDMDKKIAEYKTYLKTGKISDRANAVKVLSFLNMLKKAGKQPKDLILSKLPILPAHYRPVQVAGDLTLSANVNHLYKDLILNNDKLKDTQFVPDEVIGEAKRAHYNAVKAVYGLGDPISIKNKEKQIKGLLAEMLGTHGGTAKTSVFQAKVVNKPLDLISRSVATGDVKLGLDEISLPQDIVWKIYSPFVIRRMVRKGTPVTQAHEYVKTKNPLAIQSLLEEMVERPVTMSRDPALHKFNLMGFIPKINPDPANKTVSVNPLVFKGFNLDLDGDQISVGVPASDQARDEIKEKMLPSKNLLTVRGFSPLYTPSNEAALGMYQMSTEREDNKPVHFDNTQQVLDAYNQGKVNIGTQIIVKHHD